jgi:hypothetical protein
MLPQVDIKLQQQQQLSKPAKSAELLTSPAAVCLAEEGDGIPRTMAEVTCDV